MRNNLQPDVTLFSKLGGNVVPRTLVPHSYKIKGQGHEVSISSYTRQCPSVASGQAHDFRLGMLISRYNDELDG